MYCTITTHMSCHAKINIMVNRYKLHSFVSYTVHVTAWLFDGFPTNTQASTALVREPNG